MVDVEFEQLMNNLQSTDNEIRSNAETNYERINPNSKFNLLMTVISGKDNDLKNRIFCGVLCRRLLDVDYEDAFESMDKVRQQEVQNQILQLILNERNVTIRKKLSDITAEIAKRQFDGDGNFQWRELLDFVFNLCISNNNDDLKITGLNIFAVVPNILSATSQENINIVGTTISKCLNQSNGDGSKQSIDVREAAVKTLIQFVISEYDLNQQNINQLRSLIPLLLQTIHDSIQENSCDDSVMKSFVELVDDASGFLKLSISSILQLCISVLQNPENESMQKKLAVEAFVSLTESCTTMVRKNSNLAHTIIQYLFNMLTDIDDDSNWSFIDEEEIDDDSSNPIIAEVALDRLAVAMKGKRLLEEIKTTVPSMLRNENWKCRHAGLKAISSMGEGLQKVMSEILGSIVDEVCRLLNDEHPRVRYAACVCIGQLSVDFEPKLQNFHHEKIMQGLIGVLNDSNNPRVQAYACSALTNFCEGAMKEILNIYLQVLMAKLLDVLNEQCNVLIQKHKKLVLEQVVTTIAAVSETARNKFEPYYSMFIPIIKWIMQNCKSDQLRTLRGKSIECISLMGLAVGKEKFLNDAQEVMDMLVNSQTNNSDMTPDDPQHSYMISAWARICKMLGKEFAPYLQYVMPPVLKTASMKPETCFMYDEDTEEVDKDWQVVKVGQDQVVAINTSGIEDKINACQMLICYARELKELFAPYVQEVANVMLPLLNFYLNDDVRTAAADIIPYLIDCSEPLGVEAKHELWNEMLNSLLQALPNEEEKPQKADMLSAIAEGIEKMNCVLPNDKLDALCLLIKQYFDEVFDSQESRAEKRRSEDYDDEEEEILEADKDDDDMILNKLAAIVHSLFKVYREAALVLYRQLSHYILRLLENGRQWSELQYGLFFLDAVLEYTGNASWEIIGPLLQVFSNSIQHTSPEVRQAAAYGYGLMAQYGGSAYNEALIAGARLLVTMISTIESRSSDNNLATENAISALTKISQHQPQCLPMDTAQFVPLWLSWLPVFEDEEETPTVYGYLCDLLEQNHPAVTSNQGLLLVVKAIVTVVHKEALPEDNAVYKRCLNILSMLAQSNETLFNQCIQNISDDEKISLNDAIMRSR